METKQCTSCRQIKPLSDFHKSTTVKDGRRSQCKECRNAKLSEWKQKHPESGRSSSAQWRDKNAEKSRAYAAAYAKANRDETRNSANNGGAKWTNEDLATVARDDISLLEISKLLGRTYGAVVTKRGNLREREARLALVKKARS